MTITLAAAAASAPATVVFASPWTSAGGARVMRACESGLT
jgi:hypothetical protein